MRARLMSLAAVAALLFFVPSAHATQYTFETTLSGANEFPPNASPGTGYAIVVFDDVANTMSINLTFSDLTTPNTAAHIHCCTTVPNDGTASVATTTPTFTGFPSGTTFGTYSNTFDMTQSSSYRAGFITDHGGTTAQAEADLLAGMLANKAYLNIHTQLYPGGEIRGFLHAVPEPTTLFLLGSGLLAAGARSRKRRS